MSAYEFFRFGWPYEVIKDLADLPIESDGPTVHVGQILRFAGVAHGIHESQRRIKFIDLQADRLFVLLFADTEAEPDWSSYFIQRDYF